MLYSHLPFHFHSKRLLLLDNQKTYIRGRKPPGYIWYGIYNLKLILYQFDFGTWNVTWSVQADPLFLIVHKLSGYCPELKLLHWFSIAKLLSLFSFLPHWLYQHPVTLQMSDHQPHIIPSPPSRFRLQVNTSEYETITRHMYPVHNQGHKTEPIKIIFATSCHPLFCKPVEYHVLAHLDSK